MAQYYAERIGMRISGVVAGCERFGLFVVLDDTCAQGFIATRDLGDEWFYYDEKRLCLTGEESGRVWRPGKRVAVTVVGANPARGQIDFALAGGA
jgi:ribonuclease R